MQHISQLGRAAPAAASYRLASRAAPPGFAPPTQTLADTSGAASPEPASAAALGMLLVAQEGSFETPQDRRARKRGLDLLRALAALQLHVVSETDEAASLRTLADLVAELPEPTAPDLGAALRSIGLRARVELARRGL